MTIADMNKTRCYTEKIEIETEQPTNNHGQGHLTPKEHHT